MASGYASIFDWRSPILSRVRASFGSSWISFWYSRTALSYFFFSTNFWAAWSTFSRSIATDGGTPNRCCERTFRRCERHVRVLGSRRDGKLRLQVGNVPDDAEILKAKIEKRKRA